MSMIGSLMPSRKSYWYSTHEASEDRYELLTTLQPLEYVAVDAAEDYHSNHDGWESTWPLNFFIFDSEDGPPLAQFEVERESVPQFYAWKRELPPADDAVDPHADSTGKPSTRVEKDDLR